MQRYHKNIYFESMEDLKGIVNRLNAKRFSFSSHTFERILERSNVESIGYFLRDLKLDESMIFEYYKDGIEGIAKVCFRVSFNSEKDLVFVLTQDKRILTIYFNQKQDNHKTLDCKVYATK